MQSSLNGSASNLHDSTGRAFATSFSGLSGTMQGLHNMHGGYNIPNMAGSLGSRNSALNNMPSGGVQPSGNLPIGRFTSNNLPVALSQLSHVSGIPNRGGVNVVGNHGFGGNANGIGSSIPGILPSSSAVANTGSANLGVPGQNRLLSGVGPQGSSQVASMLGNSYPSAGGLSQNHVQAVNSLSSMGMLNDVNSNDSTPFDINLDFPQLTSRPSSSGGSQGQLGSLRKQIPSMVQQNQEFSIQNEDFPALPGFKGGSADYGMDMHQKDQIHDNPISLMQSQHFSVGRSAGFNLGGSYSSHRQQQQQQQHASSVSSSGISYPSVNNQELLQFHGSDIFSSPLSTYHSQTGGPPGLGLRPLISPTNVSDMGSYDQLMQQYQQSQNPSQFRLQQMSSVNQSFRDQGTKSMQASPSPPDPFSLLALLNVIVRRDPLALGIDLTTLGLNLNSSEDLHKTFSSPWSDEPAKDDPEFTVPECYYAKPPPALHQGFFAKFRDEALLYIFYSMPRDEGQMLAAMELCARGWGYHKELRLWLLRVPNLEPLVKTATYERASYYCFDPVSFKVIQKDNLVLHYDMLEEKPTLPQH
ncbi:hypothetical protein MLD38_003545 [Melastoma candidum]|uniref:Uncharacterized protein n=1 Tax=Melastoma candidum TaxID=119954 RepID=A0ACB9S262_9MYRT|nr:hypothetical protein MLD38_003545 [Melastoma candidum]